MIAANATPGAARPGFKAWAAPVNAAGDGLVVVVVVVAAECQQVLFPDVFSFWSHLLSVPSSLLSSLSLSDSPAPATAVDVWVVEVCNVVGVAVGC